MTEVIAGGERSTTSSALASIRALLGRRAARVARAAGRAEPTNRSARRGHGSDLNELMALEGRVMLAGDHASLPVPWTPSPASTLLAPDTANAATNPLRGRAQANGEILAGDPGDLFRFVVPATGPRTRDFISVLADTTGVVSTLDTFVEVYNAQGTLIASSGNNGSLSVGLANNPAQVPVLQRSPDGWVGFEGDVGATYYIRVRADTTPITGRTATGSYIVKIDAASVQLDVNQDPDVVQNGVTIPNIDFGRAFADNTLTSRQEDIVYRVTTPNLDRFSSLASFLAIAEDTTALNPHLDVYSTGNTLGVVQRLAGDTDAGRQTDSFTTLITNKQTTYYVRVRADDLRATPPGQSTGQFQLIARFAANAIDVDDTIRQGQTGQAITASDDPATPWSNMVLRGPGMMRTGTDAQLFRFTAQGTGLAIVTVLAGAAQRGLEQLAALPQPAMRLYDAQGNSIDFNKGDGSAELQIAVVGGQTYYLVVEGFDNEANGGFQVFIEAHHTNDPAIPVDDHVDTPGAFNAFQLGQATPLRFGDPFRPVDAEGNQERDSNWKQTAVGRGRIQGGTDTDLFQFTAPVNQLDTFAGDDGNQPNPIYVGGNFANAGTDPRTGDQYVSNDIGLFDAGRWFPAGLDAAVGPSFNGAIFAMAEWDIDGSGGTAPPVLAVGGSFTQVNGQPAQNIAFRVFDAQTGFYVWSTDPLTTTSDNPLTVNGTVFTMASGDVRPAALQQNVNAPELYVGGSFTNFTGVAANNVFGVFLAAGGLAPDNMGNGVTGGANPAVLSMTLWDPTTAPSFQNPISPAPGTAPTTPVDVPLSLYYGGRFTTGNTVFEPTRVNQTTGAQVNPNGSAIVINNIARYGTNGATDDTARLITEGLPNRFTVTFGQAGPPVTVGTAQPTGYGVTGVVRALTTWDSTGEEPRVTSNAAGTAPTDTAIPRRLIIGGSITAAGTGGANALNVTNLVAYDPTRNADFLPAGGAANNNFLGSGRFVNIGAVPNQVNALANWVVPAISGGQLQAGDVEDEVLLIGGDGANAAQGLVRILTDTDGGAQVAPGVLVQTNATVRTINVFNPQAPGYPQGVNGDGTPALIPTVYIGGDFTQVDGTDDIFGISRLRIDLTDPAVFVWEALGTGVQNLAPGQAPGTPVSVNVILPFNDAVATKWDRGERAGSGVSIVLSPTAEARFNGEVRVFDSNFNLVWTNQFLDPVNQTPNPSGVNDPSLTPLFQAAATNPAYQQTGAPFVRLTLWGGEVYYIEVSNEQDTGTGRYTLTVTTDALPPQAPALVNSGAFPDSNGTYTQPPGAGQFANAPEITIEGSGRGRAFRDPLNQANPSAYSTRSYPATASGISRVEFSDSPVLARVGDTHLFQFRAPNDGTVEVRLATKNITRAFQQQLTNAVTGQTTSSTATKRLNSPLRGAIRVFNNDFVQLGFSNQNDAVNGFADTFQVSDGTQTDPLDDGVRSFTHDDPRLVINVRRGNVYFVQVESAFLGTFLSTPDLVDWRFATGAYDLLLSTTPSLNGTDDHWPNTQFQQLFNGVDGTRIPIDTRTGGGSINGEIRNLPGGPFPNPTDADSFIYIAEARGQVNLRLTPTNPALAGRVRVFDVTQNQVATGAGGAGVISNVQFQANQGDRFFIVVDGGSTQGTYTVAITAPAQTDDQPFSNATYNQVDNPDRAGWANATGLQLNRFLGVFGLPGTSGSVDAARGTIDAPNDADIYKFTAETFEIATLVVNKIDATLNPFVRVYEISKDGADNDVFLKIAENDDVSGTDNNSRVSFSVTPGRDYYVIVEGASFDSDFGRYSLAVNVAPTDDHPNRIDFPLSTTINVAFDNVNFTGAGSVAGAIQRNGDDDLFRFTAPATGRATVTLTRAAGSALLLDVLVLDNNNVPLAGVTRTGTTAGPITVTLPSVVQNTQYYLLVRADSTATPGVGDTGGYSLAIATEPIDDHPNQGNFGSVGVNDTITLNTTSGVGTGTGVLVPTADTDLFRFSSLAAGQATIRVTTPGSVLNPKITVFDASQNQIGVVNGNGDSATLVINATAASQLFYVLVSAADGATSTAAVGGYTVTVVGTLPGGGGGGGQTDDFPNAGEWNDAAQIGLDARSGGGSIGGIINFAGDTDLFKFTPAANGQVDIQLNTPAGGLVDGQLKVFNSSFSLIQQDSAGGPGASAVIRFTGVAGQTYFLLAEPIGSATGSYTLRVATQPTTNFLFFPEGFAGATIDEFVPLVNSNAFAVDYQIFARYETGDNPNTPIATGTIPANSRGGVTISTRANQAGSLVRIGVPYALEVQSTAKLGATFSHYDFSASIGESFSDRSSTTWSFAEVNKDRNNYRDFMLFYNPGNVAANVTVTLYYADGQTTSFSQSVPALRRGGINFDEDSRIVRSGKFGVRVTSDLPIVSSLSSYNLPRSGGDGLLGDADGGSTRGVVTNIVSGGGSTASVSILNTNSAPATVTFTANYARVDIPNLVRVFNVPANSSFNVGLASLGLLAGQTAGLSYSSNLPVTFQAWEYKFGDGNTTTSATSAGREFTFGDLFVNPALAGLKYIEQLGLYNPTGTAATVNIRFLFTDGTSTTLTRSLNAGSFDFVQIDQQTPIISRPSPTAFSLQVSSNVPFIASLTHYDLFLNGGWSALGSQVGLSNALNTIT